MEKEMMRKLIIALKKIPYLITMAPALTASFEVIYGPGNWPSLITKNKLEKSTFPKRKPMGGMIISSTKDFTIKAKADPMTTPMAISIAFPFMANSLNSFIIVSSLPILSLD